MREDIDSLTIIDGPACLGQILQICNGLLASPRLIRLGYWRAERCNTSNHNRLIIHLAPKHRLVEGVVEPFRERGVTYKARLENVNRLMISYQRNVVTFINTKTREAIVISAEGHFQYCRGEVPEPKQVANKLQAISGQLWGTKSYRQRGHDRWRAQLWVPRPGRPDEGVYLPLFGNGHIARDASYYPNKAHVQVRLEPAAPGQSLRVVRDIVYDPRYTV